MLSALRNRAHKIDFEPDIIKGAAGLASPQALSLRLNCLSPPNGWRSGRNKDELGYKSFFEKTQGE